MPFELFYPKAANRVPIDKEPIVKMYRSGKFALNRPALEAIGNAVEAQLLFDPERRAVGIKPVPEGTPKAYRINPSNRTVGTPEFFSAYKLPRDAVYKGKAQVEDGILVFELSQMFRYTR